VREEFDQWYGVVVDGFKGKGEGLGLGERTRNRKLGRWNLRCCLAFRHVTEGFLLVPH